MKRYKKYIPVILFILALVIGGYLIFSQPANIFNLSGQNPPAPSPTPQIIKKSPLSGLSCANAGLRPLAVMLAGDSIARPLSGLASADLVFEMPVVTAGINRFMAVFVCSNPSELGSIRSARHDFIPLARGLDAIFVHWGGSHFALDKLDAGIMDNLDALKNPFDVFWRKSGVAAPHNGFSSADELRSAAEKLGYRLENKFGGYLFLENFSTAATTTKILSIGYPGEFAVKYQYNPLTNDYRRFRNGTKEMDQNTKTQVMAKNVVIMRAFSRQIEGQYNDVEIEGRGNAVVYRNGEEIKGAWKKDAKSPAGKLFFYDQKGQEIKFVPGQIWIEVVEPDEGATYE